MSTKTAVATGLTPGPWQAGWSGDPTREGKERAGPITIVAMNLGGVADCRPIPSGHARTWDIVEANARLIAAAPSLLAALKALVDLLNNDLDEDQAKALDDAVTAIASAEGRTV